MSKLVPPHGGWVSQASARPDRATGRGAQARRALKKVPVTSREVSDLFMLGMGAYTPLDGFMGYDDWRARSPR